MSVHGLQDPGWAVQHPYNGGDSYLVMDDLLTIPFKLFHLEDADRVFRENGDVFHKSKPQVRVFNCVLRSTFCILMLYPRKDRRPGNNQDQPPESQAGM